MRECYDDLDWRRRSQVTWAVYDAFAESWLAKDPLYRALMASAPLNRLRDVRFLGAIDLLSSQGQNRKMPHQSRYFHSVGVAYLSARACANLAIHKDVTKVLVSAALLHDVGHGALSHSSEPYFESRFRISHKHVGSRLIHGDLFLGQEVREILGDYKIDPAQLSGLLSGADALEGAPPLFALPINVDTLDGIVRSAAFFDPGSENPLPDYYLAALVNPSPGTAHLADQFWNLKDFIYRDYIYDVKWSIYDQMLSVALEDAGKSVKAADFYLADDYFCEKFLFQLARVQHRRADLESAITAHLSREPRALRRFCINKVKRLDGWRSIEKRYSVRRQ